MNKLRERIKMNDPILKRDNVSHEEIIIANRVISKNKAPWFDHYCNKREEKK